MCNNNEIYVHLLSYWNFKCLYVFFMAKVNYLIVQDSLKIDLMRKEETRNDRDCHWWQVVLVIVRATFEIDKRTYIAYKKYMEV